MTDFLLSSSIFFRQTSFSSCCIFSSAFDRCIFLLITMSRRKIPLDSSSTTLFYDPFFHYYSFCWLQSFVDKFFVIITANFSISGCCYLAYPLILFIWLFFLLSSSIFFRQTFPSSCCIFLLIAMPRQKSPLDFSSTTLFYDSSFHCRSFRWFRCLVNKFFVNIFWRFPHSILLSPCFTIYLFTIAILSSLFLNLLSTNFSFFLLHFFRRSSIVAFFVLLIAIPRQ